jgi:ribosomal subunit interface protein
MDEVQDYFDKKIGKLSKYRDLHDEGAHLEIEALRNTKDYLVRLSVPISGHPNLVAEVKERNAMTAISHVIEKIDHQLAKLKTIREKNKKHPNKEF